MLNNKLPFLFLIISKLALISAQGRQDGIPPRAYVETENGALIGNTSLSRDGHTFYQFLGIPYGTIPERFGPAQPALSWRNNNTPKTALDYGPACLQINEFTGEISGQEACLFLNVYTRQLPFRNNTPSLPVIFVIHLGGFAMGDSKNLGPSYMMDEEVVIVTANWRLGPFGFLNAGVAGARGNQGLKDLILALRWVQKEISNFGGDPRRVVVEGSSSGSFAASYMAISPLAKGLISGVISHSGSALCPWTKQFRHGMALENARKLAVAVDCPSSNPTYLVDCLKRLDPKVLLEATFPADSVLFNVSYPQFGPSLETYKNIVEDQDLQVFLGQDPYKYLEGGDFNRVPYILGLTANEGLLVNAAGVLSDNNLVDRLNTEWGRVAPNTFIYEPYAKDPCKVSGEISQFYFAKKNISKQDPWTANQLSVAYADRWFHKCSRDFAILYAKFAPIYLYNFTRAGSHSLVDHFGWYSSEEKMKPPSHADEIQYLFHNPALFPEISSNPNQTSPSDYNFSKTFVQMVTNFAATGVGRYSCTGDLCRSGGGDQDWPTASSSSPRSGANIVILNDEEDSNRHYLQWLQLDNNSEMEFEHDDFLSRMDFWENLELNDYGTQDHLPTPTTTTTHPSTPTTTTTTASPLIPKPSDGRNRGNNMSEPTPPGEPLEIPPNVTDPSSPLKPNLINFQINILFSLMFPSSNNTRMQNAIETRNISSIPVNLTISRV